MSRPISAKHLQEQDEAIYGESCFGKMWSPEDKNCAPCHDADMCGIVFRQAMKKKAKRIEQSENFMDKNSFDDINPSSLLLWCAAEERRFSELVTYVHKCVPTMDEETVKQWCKSYIIEHPKLTVSKGVIQIVA